jgi:hypothetical protein
MIPMKKAFTVGDHVGWNSEAGDTTDHLAMHKGSALRKLKRKP